MIEAFLLFLPTTIVPSLFLYLIIALFKIRKMEKKDFNTPLFKIILVIVFLSITNFVITLTFGYIDTKNSGGMLSLFPYSLFMIPTYIIAKTMDRKVLIWIFYFICLEIFIGVLEYLIGTVSFFKISDSDFASAGDALLYNKRVCGISLNSSTMALKCLLGLIIIYLVNPRYKIIAIAVIIIGFFITFNRTYIFASFPLLLFFYWDIIKKYKYRIFIVSSCVVGVTIFAIVNFSTIMEQLMRGATTDSIEVVSSGRDLVYSEFWSFFSQNFFLGNGSVKLWLELMPHKIYHAHNSFLMTFASNGFVVSFFYIYMCFAFVNKNNRLPIICIIIASLTQYTIFWGISLMDIVFIMLLSLKHKPFLETKTLLNKY